jgi:hypothetical protein
MRLTPDGFARSAEQRPSIFGLPLFVQTAELVQRCGEPPAYYPDRGVTAVRFRLARPIDLLDTDRMGVVYNIVWMFCSAVFE